jgi:DNA repair exonuclease SbcCD nuclease subunit
MTVTAIFIGDPHIQIDNIPEVELLMEKLVLIVKEKQPDIIIIAGDLLHTHERLHTIALNKAYELVHSMRNIAPTYILVGNHDYINNKQFLTENHWMNAMKEWDNTIIVDKVIVEKIKGLKFVFIPYVCTGSFIQALDTVEDEWKDATCIFAHQELYGCKMEAKVSVEGDRWHVDNPLIISGHIHSKQKIQQNIYYPGTPLQHTFGESGDINIIAYLTFSEENYVTEEIDLELPRKKNVYIDVDDVDNYDVPITEDHIKVTVKGDYEQFKTLKKTKKYKNLVEKGVKIVFKPEKDKVNIADNDEYIGTDFNNILESIVIKQKNPYLSQSYELIVNNKEIDINDIMFL